MRAYKFNVRAHVCIRRDMCNRDEVSGVAVGFGCDAYVGLEEAVEECDVVKAEAECNLFYLQVCYFELRFGVRHNSLDNNISGRSVSHRFDS